MSTGPLEGYRVIELGQGIAAATAGMHLGDGGADVVKVEHLGGDVSRTMPPFYAGGDSGVFVATNRNKRGVELDLTSAAAQDVVRVLIGSADVLIEDVDFTRELGLDSTNLVGATSTLVHCRISGWGPNGPMSNLPGAEIAAQMAAEATTSLGSLTEPPVRLGTDTASTHAGIYAAQGILAALLRRCIDGEGQKVDVSLFGAMLMMRSTLWAAQSNPDDWFGFHNDSYVKPADYGYKVKDGTITLVVGRLNDEQWTGLFHELALVTLLTPDEQNLVRTDGGPTARFANVTKPLWEKGLKNFTVDECAVIFNRLGGNAYRINDYPHFLNHPQTRHLDILREVVGSGGTVTVMKPPWHFSDDPVDVRIGPPSLGQHNAEVLAELGYDASAVAALRSQGALA